MMFINVLKDIGCKVKSQDKLFFNLEKRIFLVKFRLFYHHTE